MSPWYPLELSPSLPELALVPELVWRLALDQVLVLVPEQGLVLLAAADLPPMFWHST